MRGVALAIVAAKDEPRDKTTAESTVAEDVNEDPPAGDRPPPADPPADGPPPASATDRQASGDSPETELPSTTPPGTVTVRSNGQVVDQGSF